MRGRISNLSGQRFGRLVVVRFLGLSTGSAHHALWECKCDCGGLSVVTSNRLKSGNTKSCGCLGREGGNNFRHGHCSTGEGYSGTYISWYCMKTRVLNRNRKSFKDYGGRGIGICSEWKDSFTNFLNDMGERPPGTTLDRIDNDLGYCKENCRWSDSKAQANNRRKRERHY